MENLKAIKGLVKTWKSSGNYGKANTCSAYVPWR